MIHRLIHHPAALLLALSVSLACRADEPRHQWVFFVYACADQPSVTREVSKGCDELVATAERRGGAQFFVLKDPIDADRPAETLFIDGGAAAVTRHSQTEVNMGAPETLVTFVRSGLDRVRPEAKVALILLGHGVGWGAASVTGGMPSACLDYSHENDGLTPGELGRALRAIAALLPRGRLDVVVVHACAQASVELAYEIGRAADYLVAGPGLLGHETPRYGWLAVEAPSMSPEQLARSAAGRTTWLGSGMTACDLSQIDQLSRALSRFSQAAMRRAARDPALARSHVFDWAVPLPSQPCATDAIGLFRYVAGSPYVGSELRLRAREVALALSREEAETTSGLVFSGERFGIGLAIPPRIMLKKWAENAENTTSSVWDAYATTRFAQEVPWFHFLKTIRDRQLGESVRP